MVSSMVLLTMVLTELTKKWRLASSWWPDLVRARWVSALQRNSSCSSGDLCARSEKQSPSELCTVHYITLRCN